MRRRTCLAAAGGSLLAATAASASTASPVVGDTYIDGNTAAANSIDGYARHADGSLTAMGWFPRLADESPIPPRPGGHGRQARVARWNGRYGRRACRLHRTAFERRVGVPRLPA